ncbi:Dynein light chain lc8-type, partial [Tolypocladium capitatum]
RPDTTSATSAGETHESSCRIATAQPPRSRTSSPSSLHALLRHPRPSSTLRALLSSTDLTMSDKQVEKPETPAPREKLEAQIKSADMTDDMQQESIEIAQEAMAKFTIEKVTTNIALMDIAQHIKRTFDERKGPTWHCIVGRNFGSFVTHETKHFIYFYLGHCAILLFKTQ